MSKEDDKIEEKSSENNSNIDEKEDIKDNENNNKKNEKNEKKNSVLSNYQIKMGGDIPSKGKKITHRLSCEAVLSYMGKYMVKKDINYLIRQSKTRKKTSNEFYKFGKNPTLSASLTQKQILRESKKKLNDNNLILIGEEKINKNEKKAKNYSKNNSEKKVYFKILNGKLNIYERAKKNLLRKNNYIQKKIEKQIQEIDNNINSHFMNKNSQEMVNNNSEYIPIQYRANQLHNKHLSEYKLYQKKIELKKIEEENKSYVIVMEYNKKNKKLFDENEWDNFINNQEYWQREKIFKIKAAELIRDSIQKENSIPKINSKSKSIISNMRKKKLFLDDIYTRLFKEFEDLQERKKMRICNSMPNFKPLLNKKIRKLNVQTKGKNNCIGKRIDKIFESLLKRKLNKNTFNNNISNDSLILNKIYGLKAIHSNYINNSNILKYSDLKNNKTKYNELYFEVQSNILKNNESTILKNKSQNMSNKYDFYNKKKKIKNLKKYNFCKSNSYIKFTKN